MEELLKLFLNKKQNVADAAQQNQQMVMPVQQQPQTPEEAQRLGMGQPMSPFQNIMGLLGNQQSGQPQSPFGQIMSFMKRL